MVGGTLSHYKILDEISRGGMGIVYKARDLKLNREVALKVLPLELVSDPERKRRFVQEAQAAAALKHPNIAVIYEIDEVDGQSFIAMELIATEPAPRAFAVFQISGIREPAPRARSGRAADRARGNRVYMGRCRMSFGVNLDVLSGRPFPDRQLMQTLPSPRDLVNH